MMTDKYIYIYATYGTYSQVTSHHQLSSSFL